jgi:serine/threonine protein phosphatase PrpC
VIGVLDGHGEFGDLVASFMAKEITTLLPLCPYFDIDLRQAVSETVAAAEKALLNKHRKLCGFSGTTLCLAVIRGSMILVANIGDSRCIIGDAVTRQQISRDHKASEPDEKERIESTGGRVIIKTFSDGYVGPARVYLKDDNLPGLAMSRSIADTIVHSVGVISTPEFFDVDIAGGLGSGKVLVLATDGMWDFVNNVEASTLAASEGTAERAVAKLMEVTQKRWSDESPGVIDDATIAAVILK